MRFPVIAAGVLILATFPAPGASEKPPPTTETAKPVTEDAFTASDDVKQLLDRAEHRIFQISESGLGIG